MKNKEIIAIMGASGFIGKNLIRFLLNNTDYSVRGLCRNPAKLNEFLSFGNRFRAIKCDVFNYEEVKIQLTGVSVAYYLIHMLHRVTGDFYDLESKAAECFGKAAGVSGVSRAIYMSGLGDNMEKLSKHLASRHNTGDILRKYVKSVIEFRASIVVGSGSISFEIVRSLVKKLPLITLPRWSNTKTQPIGINDVLLYLEGAIKLPVAKNEIIEIGGPEQMSYQNFLEKYAEFLGKRILFLRLPFLPGWFAAWWLYLFNPKEAATVGKNMVSSFRNKMVISNNRASKLFPNIIPKPIESDFTL
jgi:uncharacterized protein YbjT (DUF2867 family)